jgi:hypothetical protein
MRLDGPDRVIEAALEAAERRAWLAELLAGQEALRAVTPLVPEPAPDAATEMARTLALVGETEGLALSAMTRIGNALQRLAAAFEADLAGHPAAAQLARMELVCRLEEWAAAAEHAAQGRGAERLEQGSDVVVTP